MDDTPSLEQLVRIYMKMRAKLQEIDKEVEEIKEQQKEVKSAIKDQMQAVGMQSAKTTFGTVSLVQKTRYYTHDWESMKAFIIENDAVDLLEKRISQANMALFLKENPTKHPPGLDSMSEFDISVRKPAKA
jgi:predicted Zn-dependent peptidase